MLLHIGPAFLHTSLDVPGTDLYVDHQVRMLVPQKDHGQNDYHGGMNGRVTMFRLSRGNLAATLMNREVARRKNSPLPRIYESSVVTLHPRTFDQKFFSINKPDTISLRLNSVAILATIAVAAPVPNGMRQA